MDKEQEKVFIEENDKFNGEISISVSKLAEIIEQCLLKKIDQEQEPLSQEECDEFNKNPLSYLMTEALKILKTSKNDVAKVKALETLLKVTEY